MVAKTLKQFLQDIPDGAQAIFDKNVVTFVYGGNVAALNIYGATWENGIGYDASGTTICGECSDFDCKKCKESRN